MNRQQLIEALQDIGAGFAGRHDKFVSVHDARGCKPMYHIHPDTRFPSERDIIGFETLKEIEEWVRYVRSARSAQTQEEALAVRYAYEDQRDQRRSAKQDR